MPIITTQDIGGNNVIDVNTGTIKITELLKISGSTINATISGDIIRNIVNGRADFTDASLNINTFGIYRILAELTHPNISSTSLR